MLEISRETLAYLIIGVVLAIAIPLTIHRLRKRKRDKLRRQGIKRYGH